MTRNMANNPSGKYLSETPAETARREAAFERAGERLRERDAAAAEAVRISKTSAAAMRAYLAMRADPGAKTDAQRAANVAAYVRRWSPK